METWRMDVILVGLNLCKPNDIHRGRLKKVEVAGTKWKRIWSLGTRDYKHNRAEFQRRKGGKGKIRGSEAPGTRLSSWVEEQMPLDIYRIGKLKRVVEKRERERKEEFQRAQRCEENQK